MFRVRGMTAIACALMSGCAVTNEPAADPAAALSEPVFRCNIEPILARQCSYLACHGIAGAALRVYSPGKLRAITPMNADESTAPLSDAEHHANFESAAAFSFGSDPLDNELIRKPLPPLAGGYAHKGGAIYTGTGDPQLLAIDAWLTGAGVCR